MRREASALRIQKDLRMFLARKAYKELCSSALCIQRGMRGLAARNELRFRRQTRAAIIIQVRSVFWQDDWSVIRKFSSTFCQFFFLVAFHCGNDFLRCCSCCSCSAITLLYAVCAIFLLEIFSFFGAFYFWIINNFNCSSQSQCRKYLAQLHYMRLKKAAITTQCAWRGKVARKELRSLKMVTTLSFLRALFSLFSSHFMPQYCLDGIQCGMLWILIEVCYFWTWFLLLAYLTSMLKFLPPNACIV